jgi:hypothetical protein
MTLEHLDTFIAFGSVMLGVSLLITILTQMVGSLLSLRGHNLERAVVDPAEWSLGYFSLRISTLGAEHWKSVLSLGTNGLNLETTLTLCSAF